MNEQDNEIIANLMQLKDEDKNKIFNRKYQTKNNIVNDVAGYILIICIILIFIIAVISGFNCAFSFIKNKTIRISTAISIIVISAMVVAIISGFIIAMLPDFDENPLDHFRDVAKHTINSDLKLDDMILNNRDELINKLEFAYLCKKDKQVKQLVNDSTKMKTLGESLDQLNRISGVDYDKIEQIKQSLQIEATSFEKELDNIIKPDYAKVYSKVVKLNMLQVLPKDLQAKIGNNFADKIIEDL